MLAADDVPDDEVNKITHENAMRWYSFDPFAHRPKRAVHGRRPAGRGRRRTCRPGRYDKGRFEITHTGTDLGKLAEQATA